MDYDSWFTGIGVRYSSLQHRLCHCAKTCLDFDQLSTLYWLNEMQKLKSLVLHSRSEITRIRSQRSWGIMISLHMKMYLNFVRLSVKAYLERWAVQPTIQIQSALIIFVHDWLCQWLRLVENCTLSINFDQDGLSISPLHTRIRSFVQFLWNSRNSILRGRWKLVKSRLANVCAGKFWIFWNVIYNAHGGRKCYVTIP